MPLISKGNLALTLQIIKKLISLKADKSDLKTFEVQTNKRIKDSTADWNENDSSKDSYVKNRTHWEEKVETVIEFLPKCTVNVTEYEEDGNTHYGLDGEYNKELIIGQKYTVNFDGEVFEDLVCYDDEGYPTLGAPWMDYSQYHFCIYTWEQEGQIMLSMYTDSTEASHTLSVVYTGVKTTIHKLDKKYLPELVQTPDWNQDNPKAKDYIKNKPDISAIQSDISEIQSDISEIQSDISEIQSDIAPDVAKDYIVLKDAQNGYKYKIYMQDGNITSRLLGTLEDFHYNVNSNGEYTITGWKQTLYGEPSTIMIVPDNVIL